MIQVLGLRNKSVFGRDKLVHAFFHKNWRFERVEDVFNPEKRAKIIAEMHPDERYNMFFTVMDCFEDTPRKFKEQWCIQFDIDKIGVALGEDPREKTMRVAEAVASVLGVQVRNMGIIFSGNGVQLFVLLKEPFMTAEYYDVAKPHYREVCKRIKSRLETLNIEAEKVDPAVWDAARIMRFPDTENRKPGLPNRMAVSYTDSIEPCDFDLIKCSGLDLTLTGQQIAPQTLKIYPSPDTDAVLDGCLFLKHCKENQAKVSEEQWYAMIGVLCRLDKTGELCHTYSEQHPSYTYDETEQKKDQAIEASGPRTCVDIDMRWGGCKDCPHYNKIASPILIRGEKYIASREFGFRTITLGKDGTQKPGRPAYQDLVKFFREQYTFVTLDSAMTMIFNRSHWEPMGDQFIKQWVMKTVHPEPNYSEVMEFVQILKCFDVRSLDSFVGTTKGKINYKNCVLELSTGKVLAHSPEYGFMATLAYDYDPKAQCPRFDQFMEEISCGNKEIIQSLLEFGGYSMSGDPYWFQKGMILLGDGANGKSLFVEVLASLVGPGNYSAVLLSDLGHEYNRVRLFGKLFNYSEETAKNLAKETEFLKAALGGGFISGREPYGKTLEFQNQAKMIMLTNHLPETSDMSYGFKRRFLIIPFNFQVKDDDPRRDPFLKEKLLKEAPGICNRFINAYKEAAARKSILVPKISSEILNTVVEESDPIRQFVQDVLVITNGLVLTVKGEIYAAYTMFCKENGYYAKNVVHFWRGLRKYIDLDDREIQEKDGVRRIRGVTLRKEY